MAWAGKTAESWMREWYASRFGVEVNELEPLVGDWWRASPDAEAVDEFGKGWGLEFKSWDPIRQREFGAEFTDQVPVQLTVQCQWYMFWCRWSRIDAVVAFANRDPRVYTIMADGAMQERLVRLARSFWRRARSTSPTLVPNVQQPKPEARRLERDEVLPEYDTVAKVRYLAKARRVEKLGKQRAELAKAWAIDHVGHRPGAIRIPGTTVSVYETKNGALAVRVTERKKT